ncbi:MAG: alpha/beta hydrolase fold domain-containing protein [Fuerstiella sp.]|nr:alpha/beta hydrolase fold domain-containing protein [Fuerstiella sp.]
MFLLSAPALPAQQQIFRDIQYAAPGGHSLTLDVFSPEKRRRPTPVIVFVHGGGWRNGDKKSGEKNAAWLVDDGFAVVSINYRLTDVAQWPAQINDCYEAVRWVRRNAAKYNFDPNRIAAWGTSAGGHLVALMGTRTCPDPEDVSSQVQAVCDWFGPSELLTMPPNNVGNGRTEEDVANSNGAKLLGATVKNVPQLAQDASALNNVSRNDCPFLIMHGSEDPGVPLSQSRRLHGALNDAGVNSTLHIVKGAGHGGKLFQSKQSRGIVKAFFTQQLMHNWPQGSGNEGHFHSSPGEAPTAWSVVQNKNIRWKLQLPETGQSTVTVWGQRLFFTTMQAVEADSELGSNIVAWCCDASTGVVIWKRDISGTYPLRLSGCFSDSSAPPPVTDGRRVCFFNASGQIVCFDLDGVLLWSQDFMTVGRSQPFLVGNNVIFTRQNYMPDDHGHFTHEHGNAPPEEWTNLQALDMATGRVKWTSACGVNMGCIPLPVTLDDGREVILAGRGGGHSPPEKPAGVSMISADDGSTIWTLPLKGFMSTQTYSVHGRHALVFHGDQHLWVDVASGKIAKQISITKDVSVRAFTVADDRYVDRVETLPVSKSRSIIQQSNLLVGDYHYFRSYTHPYIGRINAVTGNLAYLQVPVQLVRSAAQQNDILVWDESQMSQPIPDEKKARKFRVGTRVSYVTQAENSMQNSRGFVVMGDARSMANGWGHHAAAIPSVADAHLYMPVMNGTVYVLMWQAEKLNENAIAAINDLGPAGHSWTRSSLSFGNSTIFAHTIRELICIGR